MGDIHQNQVSREIDQVPFPRETDQVPFPRESEQMPLSRDQSTSQNPTPSTPRAIQTRSAYN